MTKSPQFLFSGKKTESSLRTYGQEESYVNQLLPSRGMKSAQVSVVKIDLVRS